jgi:hypothetical protein
MERSVNGLQSTVYGLRSDPENHPDRPPGADRRPQPGGRRPNNYLITNGFGTVVAVEIQTLLTWRYSLIISWPLSRPMPERL